jgi:hypothetical protein
VRLVKFALEIGYDLPEIVHCVVENLGHLLLGPCSNDA